MIDTYLLPRHEIVGHQWAESYRELSAAAQELVGAAQEYKADAPSRRSKSRLNAAIKAVEKILAGEN